MARQSVGNPASGRRASDAVTCDARFTSAVFDGHALEARCYLACPVCWPTSTPVEPASSPPSLENSPSLRDASGMLTT